jgi:hypothetical protein
MYLLPWSKEKKTSFWNHMLLKMLFIVEKLASWCTSLRLLRSHWPSISKKSKKKLRNIPNRLKRILKTLSRKQWLPKKLPEKDQKLVKMDQKWMNS